MRTSCRPLRARLLPKNELVTLGGPETQLRPSSSIQREPAFVKTVLNHFQGGDLVTGRKPEHRPLEPSSPTTAISKLASFLLYHYPNPRIDDSAIDTLGQSKWTQVKADGYKDGDPVAFEITIQQGDQKVRIIETYTLDPHAYHLGLEVKMEQIGGNKEVGFRYQLTGPHAIPIEGQWYASVYRNVFIGQVDGKNNVERNMQELRARSATNSAARRCWSGDKPIRYAMVANQFFALQASPWPIRKTGTFSPRPRPRSAS